MKSEAWLYSSGLWKSSPISPFRKSKGKLFAFKYWPAGKAVLLAVANFGLSTRRTCIIRRADNGKKGSNDRKSGDDNV